ncbi:hypothetical protein EDB96_2039 [Flavobacterium sp. S87F.05.LMB.W.Kidney.N]|nr:hypothetical protein EDB96_2039 [Flavobacterium sp. S87F.05.LMB.W.Kidney.N]
MKFLKDFWLDYAVSNYVRLKKHDNDPEIDILLNTSFIQSINLDILLVIVFKFVDFRITDYKYLIVTTVSIFVFNFVWYNRLKAAKKIELKERVPKYGIGFYRTYALFSAVSLFLIVYLLR